MEIESLPILGPALAVPLAAPVTILRGWTVSLKDFRRVFFFSGLDSPFRGRPRFREGRESGGVFFAPLSRPSITLTSMDLSITMAPESRTYDLKAS